MYHVRTKEGRKFVEKISSRNACSYPYPLSLGDFKNSADVVCVIGFMYLDNTVDSFEDSFVVDIHIETSVAVVAINIKHLAVHCIHSISVDCKMAVAVIRHVPRNVLSLPGSHSVNIYDKERLVFKMLLVIPERTYPKSILSLLYHHPKTFAFFLLNILLYRKTILIQKELIYFLTKRTFGSNTAKLGWSKFT